MSMIAELIFFLGFQVKQMREGIFIPQEKYTKDLLKRFNMDECKPIKRYLKHTSSIGLWYPKGARFQLVGYSDSDHAGCKIDRKSTSRGCHVLGRSLVSWSSKKQNSVALSTVEAEYIAAGACCA